MPRLFPRLLGLLRRSRVRRQCTPNEFELSCPTEPSRAGTFRSIGRLLETSASTPILPAGVEVLTSHDRGKAQQMEIVAQCLRSLPIGTSSVEPLATSLEFDRTIACCNRLNKVFASLRSKPKFSEPNSSGARRSRTMSCLRVSPSSKVVSTKILTSMPGLALFRDSYPITPTNRFCPLPVELHFLNRFIPLMARLAPYTTQDSVVGFNQGINQFSLSGQDADSENGKRNRHDHCLRSLAQRTLKTFSSST